jgi:hypothetical protein
MSADKIDLQPFCSTDVWRPYLLKPFRYKGYVYATDGLVMLRVADDESFVTTDRVDAERVLAGLQDATFLPAPAVALPPAPIDATIKCPDCDGRGKEHKCPDCDCECEGCDGAGKIKIVSEVSTMICGHIFNIANVRKVDALPGLEIAPASANVADLKPMLFRFAGGVGAMMPMRAKAKDHIEIERATTEGEPSHV